MRHAVVLDRDFAPAVPALGAKVKSVRAGAVAFDTFVAWWDGDLSLVCDLVLDITFIFIKAFER